MSIIIWWPWEQWQWLGLRNLGIVENIQNYMPVLPSPGLVRQVILHDDIDDDDSDDDIDDGDDEHPRPALSWVCAMHYVHGMLFDWFALKYHQSHHQHLYQYQPLSIASINIIATFVTGKIGNPHEAEGIKLDKVFTLGTGIITCRGTNKVKVQLQLHELQSQIIFKIQHACARFRFIFPDSAKIVRICWQMWRSLWRYKYLHWYLSNTFSTNKFRSPIPRFQHSSDFHPRWLGMGGMDLPSIPPTLSVSTSGTTLFLATLAGRSLSISWSLSPNETLHHIVNHDPDPFLDWRLCCDTLTSPSSLVAFGGNLTLRGVA